MEICEKLKFVLPIGGIVGFIFLGKYFEKRSKEMNKEVEIKVNVDEARMEAVRKARAEEGLSIGTSAHECGNWNATDNTEEAEKDRKDKWLSRHDLRSKEIIDQLKNSSDTCVEPDHLTREETSVLLTNEISDFTVDYLKKTSLTVAEKKELTERFGGMTLTSVKPDDVKVVNLPYIPEKKQQKPSLTVAEKKELTERFGGMSKEEIDFIIDLIPVEYCLNRIHRELDKAKDFENKVKSAMASLG